MLSMKILSACLMFLCVFGAHNAFSSESSLFEEDYYTVNICNFAPYPVVTHAAACLNGEFEFSDKALAAGQCETIVKTRARLGKPSVHLNAYPVSNDTVVRYFRNEKWFSEDWEKLGTEQHYGASHDGLLFCVSKDDQSKKRRVADISDCQAGETLQAYSPSVRIDDDGVGYWVIIDPVISAKLTELDFSSDANTFDEFSSWAHSLYYAVSRLEFLKNPEIKIEGVFPTLPGIELYDHNGMFDLGIAVKSALGQTPLGTPILLKKGDIILCFNGVPVFGYDIVKLIYDAGKNYGYNKANDVLFLRDGQLHKTTIALFFDEDIWGNVFLNPDDVSGSPIPAALLAAINEYTFYSQNILTCLIDSLQDDSAHYADYTECKFQRDQILAAYKQFHPKSYFTGELFGGVTFIGRTFFENVLVKNVTVFRGKNLYSRIIRAAVLESAEESARTLYTSPPGSSTEILVESMKKRAKLQGIIGVGFQISPLLTSIGVGPLFMESYNNL